MSTFNVETLEDLDNFDTEGAYWLYGTEYSVYVKETKEVWFPVYHIRPNGDMDGFEGWM